MASAIGFGIGVGDVTFSDSHFVNPVYGIRIYPLGYYALIFCLLEFYLTFRLTSVKRSLIHLRNPILNLPVTRAIWAFLVPIIVTLIISPNFLTAGSSVLPEFPHRGLMGVSFVAGLFCGAGTYIHNLRDVLDFSYVSDSGISDEAKIEMLKVTHSTRSDVLKLLVALYVGIAGLYLIYGWNLSLQASGGNVTEAFFRNAYGQLFILFYSIFLVAGIVAQLLGGMADVQDQLLNIRSSGTLPKRKLQ
jgi:hypothetical protein